MNKYKIKHKTILDTSNFIGSKVEVIAIDKAKNKISQL